MVVKENDRIRKALEVKIQQRVRLRHKCQAVITCIVFAFVVINHISHLTTYEDKSQNFLWLKLGLGLSSSKSKNTARQPF